MRKSLSAFIRQQGAPEIHQDRINWHSLNALVRSRHLEGIFSSMFTPGEMPSSLTGEWFGARMQYLAQGTLKLKVATRIFGWLEAAGIPAVAMRGLSLAQRIYADISFRPMHDIDLLVRPADCERLFAVMREAGFEPVNFFRSQYVYRIEGITVEIHWSLLTNKRYREKICADEFVQARLPHETPEGLIFRLPDDKEIIGLITHAFIHHELDEIQALVDIGYFLRRQDLDWESVVSFCRKARLSKMAHFTLAFIAGFFELDRDDILKKFNLPPVPEKMLQTFENKLFSGISLIDYLQTKRALFYVAEDLPVILREMLRLFSKRNIVVFADLLKKTVFKRFKTLPVRLK
ncbi:MAG: nucleotidyltransferase family protein [Proteobacteria bacterium]|nr:nucleotidyltransferase family protein [Pseudomonadota bacterium]MBU1708810.1 nucleotidyltransferase family protein [Pseudomonadota bacterium]